MEVVFDLWHLAFADLVQERAPPSFIVESEVRLSIEPQRRNPRLVRRTDTPRDDSAGRVLHAIWPLLAQVTIVELESPPCSSFRKGDLVRLGSYGGLYRSTHLRAPSSGPGRSSLRDVDAPGRQPLARRARRSDRRIDVVNLR